MSDHWEFYPCQMGDHRAFIFYDHGASKSIDSVACSTLLKVRATIRKPNSRGLPTDEEFEPLKALEERLADEVAKRRGIYVGRVTVDGHRHFSFFAPLAEADAKTLVAGIAAESGYELFFFTEHDPRHEGYWKELFPSDDDWQVLKDLKVVENLEKEGDKLDLTRRVDHWAYFPDTRSRLEFERWLRGSGFEIERQLELEGSKMGFGIHFFHSARPLLEEISSHTIGLMRQAKSLGGDYDGWETSVERSDA